MGHIEYIEFGDTLSPNSMSICPIIFTCLYHHTMYSFFSFIYATLKINKLIKYRPVFLLCLFFLYHSSTYFLDVISDFVLHVVDCRELSTRQKCPET